MHINAWFEVAHEALVWPRQAVASDRGGMLLPGAVWNELLVESAVEAYVDLLQVSLAACFPHAISTGPETETWGRS